LLGCQISKRLNGSQVSADERDTANRAFVRHYVNAETKPPRYSKQSSISLVVVAAAAAAATADIATAIG